MKMPSNQFLFDYIFGSFCSNETFFHCVKLRIYDQIVNKKTAANNNREMIQRETRMWHPGEFQVKVSSITSNIIQQHNTVNSHQYISQDNTHQWLPPETKLIKPSRIFPLHNINTTLFSKILTRYEIYCY